MRGNIAHMMQQAQRMQDNLKRVQDELAVLEVTVAPVALAASATELKIGTLYFCWPAECSKNCPPLPGVTPATTCVP